MATIERTPDGLRSALLNDQDAALAKAAQRCIMAALDHSRAPAIALINEDGESTAPSIKLPPLALRLIAQVLGAMGERKPVTLVPSDHELSTIQAARLLNVSRPFLIKEIEANRLPHHKVGSHRRINYEDLMVYRASMRESQERALQNLADIDQELNLGN